MRKLFSLIFIPIVMCGCSSNDNIDIIITKQSYTIFYDNLYVDESIILYDNADLSKYKNSMVEHVSKLVDLPMKIECNVDFDGNTIIKTHPIIIRDDSEKVLLSDEDASITFIFNDNKDLTSVYGAINWNTTMNKLSLKNTITDYELNLSGLSFDTSVIDYDTIKNTLTDLLLDNKEAITTAYNKEIYCSYQLEYTTEYGLIYYCTTQSGSFIKLNAESGEVIDSFYFNGEYT